MTKDELFRCLSGCAQAAINDHGPEVQAASIAKRMVSQVYGLILEERLAERERCAAIAGGRRHVELRILLGDCPGT